ncbi:MAG TPA: hypothetical protein VH022_01725, partial [Candidatus Acidoferrum sp.]|nr:hypothetical protein [Candidatus Acidoferrum sp.]
MKSETSPASSRTSSVTQIETPNRLCTHLWRRLWRAGLQPTRATKPSSIDQLFLLSAFALALLAPSIAVAQSQTQPPPHTTIYLHGRIYTNDPAHPWASALAVR